MSKKLWRLNTLPGLLFATLVVQTLMYTNVAGAADQATNASGAAPLREQPAQPAPDDRYKADILVVVAHPDDDLLIATYLAKASVDDHKRVAVVYGTRGDAGGNQIGYEQAASLALVREMEARRALAMLNISNVWFLSAPDTPAPTGHDVLRSLESWHHGAALAEVVRIVRLTRPAAIVTFLPCVVVGENHEDHQAAGVIATEAFDIAGDPTQFPEQVAFPLDRRETAQLLEGLQPWQAQKLYYFSDADDPEFLKGKGPEYPVTDVSATRHLPYYRIWMAVSNVYETQNAKLPLNVDTPPASFNPPPIYFLRGKSNVGGALAGDILESTRAGAISFAPVPGYHGRSQPETALELGGAWHFYREFWRAHALDPLAQLQPVPEIATAGGGTLNVPILLRNSENHSATVELRLELPAGWVERKGSGRYPIDGGAVYPVTAVLTAPSPRTNDWEEIRLTAESGGRAVGSARLRVRIYGAN